MCDWNSVIDPSSTVCVSITDLGMTLMHRDLTVWGRISTHEEPTILHTKKFRIGSGNIIGKGVIQDFFICASALPTMGGSILHKTSCLADAISLLVVEIERKFIYMHPCIQRIFLEFSNIEHSSGKQAATIFLAHEFRFIIKEDNFFLRIIGWMSAVLP